MSSLKRKRPANSPSKPQQGLLRVGVVDPRPLLHKNTPLAGLPLDRCVYRLNPQPKADIDKGVDQLLEVVGHQ